MRFAQCRYIGLAKTHLQHVITAAAINLVRIAEWHNAVPTAQTRRSRFAALRLVLLCHNLSMVEATLAAGTPYQLACKAPGNDDADRGDGGLHMAFRSNREPRGIGNLRVAEVS